MPRTSSRATLWQRVLAAWRAQSIANCRVCCSFAGFTFESAVGVVAMSHLRQNLLRQSVCRRVGTAHQCSQKWWAVPTLPAEISFLHVGVFEEPLGIVRLDDAAGLQDVGAVRDAERHVRVLL